MEGKVPSSPYTGLSLNIGRSSRREVVVTPPPPPSSSSSSSSAAAIMRRRVDLGHGKEVVIAGERRNVVEITQRRQPVTVPVQLIPPTVRNEVYEVDLVGNRRNVLEIGQQRRQPPPPTTARIDEYEDEEYEGDYELDGAGNRRKRVHRHNADQIRELEFHFGISHHPDEIQRRELGNRVGLSSQQVKFWFQNRRTQTRNLQERHLNLTIKNEIELVKEENNFLRDAINKCICINCGFPGRASQEHHLKIENARLLSQLEMFKKSAMDASATRSSAFNTTTTSVLGLDGSRITRLVDKALVELIDMSNMVEAVWLLNMGNGIGGRDNNENVSRFRLGNPTSGIMSIDRCVDVSRELVTVLGTDIGMLVKCFMDVKQWKDVFPGMVSKATTLNVVNEGELMNHKNGSIQMMVAEYQMLTPIVSTKELHFFRHCKQLGPKKWAIVDIGPDNNVQIGSTVGFKRRPSGVIIEDKSNGEFKVLWLEQMECENISTPINYPRIVSAAYSARHWATTLQQYCEQLAYTMSPITFPTNESTVDDDNHMVFETMLERKNIMNLAHKMKVNFCHTIGMASFHLYSNTQGNEDGYDITFSVRRNINDPGEPIGTIICAVTSVWLPISRFILSDYLQDASRKHEWDMLLNGKPVYNVATLAKGPNQLNSITIQAIEGNEGGETRILQDCSINEFETMLVYASMETSGIQFVAKGGDPGQVRMLASGFSILREGLELRPIIGHVEGQQGGCLLTLAFQVLASNSTMNEMNNKEYVESVGRLVSFTLRNIKEKLKCE